jgi:hypothetical protein
MVGRRARSDLATSCRPAPRLPPENPHLKLTTSDKRRSVSDRVCAAQHLFLTANDKVGIATDGNKGFWQAMTSPEGGSTRGSPGFKSPRAHEGCLGDYSTVTVAGTCRRAEGSLGASPGSAWPTGQSATCRCCSTTAHNGSGRVSIGRASLPRLPPCYRPVKRATTGAWSGTTAASRARVEAPIEVMSPISESLLTNRQLQVPAGQDVVDQFSAALVDAGVGAGRRKPPPEVVQPDRVALVWAVDVPVCRTLQQDGGDRVRTIRSISFAK